MLHQTVHHIKKKVTSYDSYTVFAATVLPVLLDSILAGDKLKPDKGHKQESIDHHTGILI